MGWTGSKFRAVGGWALQHHRTYRDRANQKPSAQHRNSLKPEKKPKWVGAPSACGDLTHTKTLPGLAPHPDKCLAWRDATTVETSWPRTSEVQLRRLIQTNVGGIIDRRNISFLFQRHLATDCREFFTRMGEFFRPPTLAAPFWCCRASCRQNPLSRRLYSDNSRGPPARGPQGAGAEISCLQEKLYDNICARN